MAMIKQFSAGKVCQFDLRGWRGSGDGRSMRLAAEKLLISIDTLLMVQRHGKLDSFCHLSGNENESKGSLWKFYRHGTFYALLNAFLREL